MVNYSQWFSTNPAADLDTIGTEPGIVHSLAQYGTSESSMSFTAQGASRY